MIRSSSLGTTCHRDEDLFIRYKDGYQMMTDRGRVKGFIFKKVKVWWQPKISVWSKSYDGMGLASI